MDDEENTLRRRLSSITAKLPPTSYSAFSGRRNGFEGIDGVRNVGCHLFIHLYCAGLNPWQDIRTYRSLHKLVLGFQPDVLVKMNRAAMASNTEMRVPMANHRVVEWAWRLSLDLKIKGGQCKWLLRNVLDSYVPKELIDRPKQGFAIPLDSWLRGPLKEWAKSPLEENLWRHQGYVNPAPISPIRNKWEEYFSGRRNWAYHLPTILMFQGLREQG